MTKVSNPLAITDTASAREYLVRWMTANFPTDTAFSAYINTELAGDFAWQLARALASKEQAAIVEAQRRQEATVKAREALVEAVEADELMSKMPHWGGVHMDMESEMRRIRGSLDVFAELFPMLLPAVPAQAADQPPLAGAN
ncbi:hypothetical protein ACWV27_26510 (plasmid) [Massilia varians]